MALERGRRPAALVQVLPLVPQRDEGVVRGQQLDRPVVPPGWDVLGDRTVDGAGHKALPRSVCAGSTSRRVLRSDRAEPFSGAGAAGAGGGTGSAQRRRRPAPMPAVGGELADQHARRCPDGEGERLVRRGRPVRGGRLSERGDPHAGLGAACVAEGDQRLGHLVGDLGRLGRVRRGAGDLDERRVREGGHPDLAAQAGDRTAAPGERGAGQHRRVARRCRAAGRT